MLALCRPQSLLTGMNKFLASLEITFRRDPTNYRPRVNKLNSIKDREQKGTSVFRLRWMNGAECAECEPAASGNYFFLEE